MNTNQKRKIVKLMMKFRKDMNKILAEDELEIHMDVEQVKKNTEEKNTIKAAVERSYEKYPRKVGKRLGLDRLLRGKYKLTLDEAPKFDQAVENIAAKAQESGMEIKYIPHFSTFVTKWEDYLEYKPTREIVW